MMEQQKIAGNILSQNNQNLIITDITNNIQKSQRSLHQISSSNIKSKSKLASAGQFVISYNFQNDPNCQVRTHNLLIGLEQIPQNHSKNNSLRKNILHRVNRNVNNNSNIKKNKREDDYTKNKLTQVKSNVIFDKQNPAQSITVKSFYSKNRNLPQNHTFASNPHFNTFWSPQSNKMPHQKHIYSNLQKIGSRKSLKNANKQGYNLNVHPNSIQKYGNSKITQSRISSDSDDPFKFEQENQNIQKLEKINLEQKRLKNAQNITKKQKLTKENNEKSSSKIANRQNYVNQSIEQIQKNTKHIPQKSPKQKYKSHHNPYLQQNVNKRSSEQSNFTTEHNFRDEVAANSQNSCIKVKNNKIIVEQNTHGNSNMQNYSKDKRSMVNQIQNQQNQADHQSLNKLKRKYHPLIKNPNWNLKVQKNPVLQQFHTIQSENQNSSSKRPSEKQIYKQNLPVKTDDVSINEHLTKKNQKGLNLGLLRNESQLESLKLYNNQGCENNQRHKNLNNSFDGNIKQKRHSSLDAKYNNLEQQQQNGSTKRKLKDNYKEFLRLLSEQNQKKKHFEKIQNEKKMLNFKNSRFSNIQQQNQHIKRILSPIGNSFLEERRKRLSDQRKTKRKNKALNLKHRDIDGSIIQSSDSSQQRGERKSKFNRKANKIQSQSPHKSSDFQRNTIKSTNQHFDPFKSINKKERQVKMNSLEPDVDMQHQKSQNQLKRAQNFDKNDKIKKSQKNRPNISEQSPFERLSGVKIPQKAILNTSSKLNRLRNMLNSTNKNSNIKNNQKRKVNAINDKPNQQIIKPNQKEKEIQNKNTHNLSQKNNFIQSEQKDRNILGNKRDIGNKGERKQIDRKSPKQKERNVKDWKSSEEIKKDQQRKTSHSPKDKNVNKKDWKEAQRNAKSKGRLQGDKTRQQIDKSTQKAHQNKSDVKKLKKQKKVSNGGNQGQEIEFFDNQISSNVLESQNSANKGYKNSSQISHMNNAVKMEQNRKISSVYNQIQHSEDNGQVQTQRQNSFGPVNSEMKNNTQQQKLQYVKGQHKKLKNTQLPVNDKEHQKDILKEEKKKQVIQNVLLNEQMMEEGFMQISQSKFDIYNHESQKSILQPQKQSSTSYSQQKLQKRADIVKFLYSLPEEYQTQIEKFVPDQNSQRFNTQSCFDRVQIFRDLKLSNFRQSLQEITTYDKICMISTSKMVSKTSQNKDNKSSDQGQKLNRRFICKIVQPYANIKGQIGIWLYCVGVWRLFTLQNTILKQQHMNQEENLIFHLQKAFQKAVKTYYSEQISASQMKREQILKMITGLRISTFTKSKNNSSKIFKEIQYNIKKSHLIRAVGQNSSPNFSQKTINCVRKIENTPTGQKVIQIVSYSVDLKENRPRYFWIKEEKFLEFFQFFTIMSRRSPQSFWSNSFLQIKNSDKAVYMIESDSRHTSGSITLYPLEKNFVSNQIKCTIAFYKQIQPQVLKLVGKACQKLPQDQTTVHTSKLYFQFNIKGTYFVFLQLEDGYYNVSIQSNSPHTDLKFMQYVKRQTLKNDQCEYVQIDKMLKKRRILTLSKNRVVSNN